MARTRHGIKQFKNGIPLRYVNNLFPGTKILTKNKLVVPLYIIPTGDSTLELQTTIFGERDDKANVFSLFCH